MACLAMPVVWQMVMDKQDSGCVPAIKMHKNKIIKEYFHNNQADRSIYETMDQFR